MYNQMNRAKSPQYGNGFPNQMNMNQPNQPFQNQYPYNGQQSPANQQIPQRQPTYPQYPQNTPPKGYQPQPSQRNNQPYSQPPSYPPSQPSVSSLQQPNKLPQQIPAQQTQPNQQRQINQIPPQSDQSRSVAPQSLQQYPSQQQYPQSQSNLALSGLNKTYTPPAFIPVQPVMTTVIQRPIEFVDLDKFEDLWNKKMSELEDKIRQAQVQRPVEETIELRAGNGEDKDELIKQLQDELYKARCDNEEKDAKITDLKIELQTSTDLVEFLRQQLASMTDKDEVLRLRQQIKTLETQLKQLGLDLDAAKLEIEQLRGQKQFFKDQCDEKDEFIARLQNEIEELHLQMDQMQEEITTSSSVKTYEEEAKIWRTKFKELNDTYHVCQEKLMLTEAELDLLKRPSSQQKIVQSTTTVVKNNVVTQSSNKNDSEYLATSLTPFDLDRISNLSKNIPQI